MGATGWLAALAAGLLAVSSSICAAAAGNGTAWVRTWAASPMRRLDIPELKGQLVTVKGQTVRERIRISAGGLEVRVRLSNEFGTKPLHIDAATLARSGTHGSIAARSVISLTFGGLRSITIPPGAPVLSDPVQFAVEPSAELTISLFLPEETSIETVHYSSAEYNSLSESGDFTHTESMPVVATTMSRAFITGVDVLTAKPTKLVVACGDSITDGVGYIGWPARLFERLSTVKSAATSVAVVNAGIGGNRVLSDGSGTSALARFDRDVLAVPGVTHVILLEGINDIGWPGARSGKRQLAEAAGATSAEQVIAGYKQLIARAHTRGLRIYGATLLPFAGPGTAASGFYTAAKEQSRQTINEWIRTSGAFDAVIDFDKAMRNPLEPARLRPSYDSGDNLHPDATGYQAMADAISLGLFQ